MCHLAIFDFSPAYVRERLLLSEEDLDRLLNETHLLRDKFVFHEWLAHHRILHLEGWFESCGVFGFSNASSVNITELAKRRKTCSRVLTTQETQFVKEAAGNMSTFTTGNFATTFGNVCLRHALERFIDTLSNQKLGGGSVIVFASLVSIALYVLLSEPSICSHSGGAFNNDTKFDLQLLMSSRDVLMSGSLACVMVAVTDIVSPRLCSLMCMLFALGQICISTNRKQHVLYMMHIVWWAVLYPWTSRVGVGRAGGILIVAHHLLKLATSSGELYSLYCKGGMVLNLKGYSIFTSCADSIVRIWEKKYADYYQDQTKTPLGNISSPPADKIMKLSIENASLSTVMFERCVVPSIESNTLREIYFKNNLSFNDFQAELLAKALKTNTSLQRLHIVLDRQFSEEELLVMKCIHSDDSAPTEKSKLTSRGLNLVVNAIKTNVELEMDEVELRGLGGLDITNLQSLSNNGQLAEKNASSNGQAKKYR